MRWNKFRLKTLAEAEDLVISALSDAGIEGVEIEDTVPLSGTDLERMFVDIMPEMPEDNGIAYLSFYLDEEADCEAVLARVREELDDLRRYARIGECTVERSVTEDVDWVNNWKQYFHQFYVDDILITPSWEPIAEKDRDRMVIQIDPGTAFGTGMHETTQLCIRALKRYLSPGALLLDIGTGSGILSIAALMLGASHAVGTDLDESTRLAVPDNLQANRLEDGSMDLLIGNLISDEQTRNAAGYEKYDVVTANILAEILVPMMEPAAAAMKSGAVIITSGILEGKEPMVEEAMRRAGLEVLEQDHQGEWACVIARKS